MNVKSVREKLLTHPDIMLSIPDAAREIRFSPSDLIKVASKHNLKLFVKVSKDMHIYCLPRPTNATSLYTSGNNKAVYYSHLVISSQDYTELAACPLKMIQFREAANIDFDTNEIHIESASNIASKDKLHIDRLVGPNQPPPFSAIFAAYKGNRPVNPIFSAAIIQLL